MSANTSCINTTNVAPYTLTIKVCIILGCGILSLFTVSGNLLTIIAYLKNKKLQNSSNFLLVSLAFADMLIGLIPLNVYGIQSALQYWPFGDIFCNISLSIELLCCQSSIYHIVLITYYRYVSIKDPFHHRVKQTKDRTKLSIVCIWILAFIQWVPWIMCYQYMVRKKPDKNTCKMLFMEENRYLMIIEGVFGFYGPLVFVLVLYFKMIRIIKSQFKKWKKKISCELNARVSSNLSVHTESAMTTHCDDNEKKSEECQTSENVSKNDSTKVNAVGKKCFKMVTAILLVFAVTWLPYSIQMMINAYCERCFSSVAYSISYVFTYMNSTANPFIYAFASMQFRNEFKNTILSAAKFISKIFKNDLQ